MGMRGATHHLPWPDQLAEFGEMCAMLSCTLKRTEIARWSASIAHLWYTQIIQCWRLAPAMVTATQVKLQVRYRPYQFRIMVCRVSRGKHVASGSSRMDAGAAQYARWRRGRSRRIPSQPLSHPARLSPFLRARLSVSWCTTAVTLCAAVQLY